MCISKRDTFAYTLSVCNTPPLRELNVLHIWAKTSKARRPRTSVDVRLKEVQAKVVGVRLKEAQAKVAKSQFVDVRLNEVQAKVASLFRLKEAQAKEAS